MEGLYITLLVVCLPIVVALIISVFVKRKKKIDNAEQAIYTNALDIKKTFMIRDDRFAINAFQREYLDVPLLLGQLKHPETNTFNQVIGTALLTQQESADQLKIDINVMDPVKALDVLEPAIAGKVLEMTEDGQITKFQLKSVSLVPQGQSKLKVL